MFCQLHANAQLWFRIFSAIASSNFRIESNCLFDDNWRDRLFPTNRRLCAPPRQQWFSDRTTEAMTTTLMFWQKAERRCATPNARYSTKSAIEIQLNHRLTCVHHRLPTVPNHLKHKQTINCAPILPNHRNQKKIRHRNAQIHLQSMFSTTEKE